MAVAIVNSHADNLSLSSLTWTFNFPFTTDVNNALVLMVTRDGSTGIDTPLNWDSLGASDASSSHTALFFLDPVNGGGISSVTLTSSSVALPWSGNIYEISGTLPENFINASDFIAYTNNESSQPVPQITVTLDNCLLLTGVGTNNNPVVALDGAVTPAETTSNAACGHTSGSLQLGTAGQIQALTHTVGNDGMCYAIAIAPASAAPTASLHTVKLDKECESTDFALGMLAIKNQSTTNEIASSIVSLSNLPTDTPQFNITYATGAPVFANGDTIHLYYDSSTGDIKSTADGIDLASFTNLLGDTCP